MQIVIPISDADTHPLTMVEGRTMIEHVTGLFSGETDFIFVCSRTRMEEAGLAAGLRRAAPTSRIITIEPHQLGPAYSTLQAAGALADDAPILISRGDFAAAWDFARFERTVSQHGCDGAVVAHRGFHPHESSLGAATYLRHVNRRLLEVRAQYGFASADEPESRATGIYYFRTGALLKHYLHRAMALGLSTNGEYMLGMPYNLMVQDGLSVYVDELSHYAEWGMPEGLEQYRRWSEFFARSADWTPARPPFHGATLIPISGSAAVFAGGLYSEVKPLFPVAGVPMIERVLRSVPRSLQTLALCRAEDVKSTPLSKVLRAARSGMRTIGLSHKMERQACFCVIPDSALDSRSPVLVAPSDASLVYDEYEFAAMSAYADCMVFTFRDHPQANRLPGQYSWVRTSADGLVDAVHARSEPSGEIREARGLTGMFWFREAGVMFDAIRHWLDTGRRSNNDFSLELILENLIAGGYSVRALDVTHYIPFVTRTDVRTFEYWESYFRKSAGHPYGKQERMEPAMAEGLVGVTVAA
ncbi:MAG TPA: hypothetical protein VHC90_04290 [Bryobacteraceae bacterium]|nr:hypothetical protein [Bryobacteraceae bacterium]